MRTRDRDELSADVRRELAALDAALAGEPVEADLADLGELALTLRSDRIPPRAEFATELDARARAGFRAEQQRPAPWYRRLVAGRRSAPLALGAAASVFIAVTAVLSMGGGDERRSGGPAPAPVSREDAPTATPQAASGAADRATGVPGAAVPLSKGGGATAPGRKVDRAAALVLTAPRGEIEQVADDAIRVTDRYGGFVMNSSVSSGEREATGASLDLRIPTSRLQPALADLSELGHVRSRTQSSADITAQFASPRRSLANALAERRSLLKQLGAAQTSNETASIRARLRLADRRIDRARTRLHRLDAQVGLASVSVAIEPGRSRQSGDWSPADALRDAGSMLGVALGVLIVGLAAAVPIALAALVFLLARRSYLRRARERSLDAPSRG